MESRNHKHLFPIVDAMVDDTIADLEESGEPLACKKGCSHCCHLLIEISWEEATELAYWILEQPKAKQEEILERLRENCREAKRYFMASKGGSAFVRPIEDDIEFSDKVYDGYFFEKKRPCAFLEDGACAAYEARPTACRLHMVSCDSRFCANTCVDDDGFDVPERVEQLKEEAAPAITALEKDGRWGHFGIMVEAALAALINQGEMLGIHPNEDEALENVVNFRAA